MKNMNLKCQKSPASLWLEVTSSIQFTDWHLLQLSHLLKWWNYDHSFPVSPSSPSSPVNCFCWAGGKKDTTVPIFHHCRYCRSEELLSWAFVISPLKNLCSPSVPPQPNWASTHSQTAECQPWLYPSFSPEAPHRGGETEKEREKRQKTELTVEVSADCPVVSMVNNSPQGPGCLV